MSAPSFSSLDTIYGSCVDSDIVSIDSTETFKSFDSNSRELITHGTDTDTLVASVEDDDQSEENFIDASEVTLAIDTDRVMGGSSGECSNSLTSVCGSDSSEQARLIGPSPVRIPSSLSSRRGIEDASIILRCPDVDTHIPARSPPRAAATSSTLWRHRASSGLLIVVSIVCSLGSQILLRFNSQLNCLTLIFWRSLLQVVVAFLGSLCSNRQIFSDRAARTKLVYHTILSWLYIVSFIFTSLFVATKDVAAVFLILPVGAMMFQRAIQRETVRTNVCIVITLLWIFAVLMLSRNSPWPAIDIGPSSNRSTSRDHWYPPVFGLDGFTMFPVQPREYMIVANGTVAERHELDPDYVSGLVVALVGLIVGSVLPSYTLECDPGHLWPILLSQAVGAGACSTAGLLLLSESFLFSSFTDVLIASSIVILGFLGNMSLLKLLTIKRIAYIKNGWPHTEKPIPQIMIGVVSRGALEFSVICIVNYLIFSTTQLRFEDWLSFTLLIIIIVLFAFARPATVSLRSEN